MSDLRAALSSQHRPVEAVDADGDDWIGCLCGERECVVLAMIPEGAVLVTEETLAAALRYALWLTDYDEPTPKEAAAAILRHLREDT